MGEEGSHKQILKSTGIIGLSQVLVIIIGIVRTKILAVLLGPVGVGLVGLFQSALDIIKGVTSFGLQYSTVRDIAVAAGTGDEKRIATTATVMKRWIWLTALLGGFIAVIFCKPISIFTFGTVEYATGIALLSIYIFLHTLASGQVALLQGLRRIKAMAKANVLGSLIGLFLAIPIYWYLGEKGIVPVFIFTAVTTFVLSSFFVRSLSFTRVRVGYQETWKQGQVMIKLGSFMMLTGFIDIATGYFIRILVMENAGVNGVGQFSAAWTITLLYISTVLNAMSADYLPRLSAVQHDKTEMRRLVNEQTEITLLLACPLIIGTTAFIHLIVQIFYTKDFSMTPTILNWQLAGDFFKILAWPMSFLFLARGKGAALIFTNLSWSITYVVITYFGWSLLGLEITGVAFLLAYLLYLFLVFFIVRNAFDFKWSGRVPKLIFMYAPLLVIALLSSKYIDAPYHFVIGAIVSVLAVLVSFYHLKNIVSFQAILKKLRPAQ